MDEQRLITVAIHTYEKAVMLKTLLESEGVEVALQNVNLVQPVVSAGVRVRIKESDLPLALRVIENAEIFSPSGKRAADTAAAPVLVPTDFSAYSIKAAEMAFEIAHRVKAPIVFLHSYIDPQSTGNIQLTDALRYDILDEQKRKAVEAEATRKMDEFTARFKGKIKRGETQPVKFSTMIVEGIPEESIVEFTKNSPTALIVMGTRGSGKKERELVGSVTAEVLDSCRVPAFTVPEATDLPSLKAIRNIVFFSNLDQEDMLAMETFYRLFPQENFDVTIVHIPGKKERKADASKAVMSLLSYCHDHYSSYDFTVREVSLATIIDDFRAIADEKPIHLIITPNKKKNIFARLFNPSLAHKLLFHADTPMMVIPV
jgi:nucleotide-binding universal stress UspA family protein